MKFKKLILPFFLVIIAFSLRNNNLADRTPFDWDQNRDYSQALSISQGNHTALGPVAKGSVGGFYLGSLYYYLLIPTFTLTSGALISLPLTSIILDSLVAGLIYFLFAKLIGKPRSLLLAIIWSVSWFLIESSRISWNVALIPIWSLFIIYALTKLRESSSTSHLYLLAFLGGLSFHIHVSLIGIFPFLIAFSYKSLRFPLKTYLQAVVIGLIPLIPLIHYDLTHAYKNLRLVRDFYATRAPTTTPIIEMSRMAIIKLGKVVNALFFAKFADSLILGLSIITLSIISFFRSRPIFKISSLIIILNTLLVIFLRDYNFPEYYFAASYLPIYLITLNLFKRLPLAFLVVIIALSINLRASSTEMVSYSLGAKQQVINSLLTYDTPLDIHLDFDPGRDGGLEYLIDRSDIIQGEDSQMQILLTDKINSPGYVSRELCEDIIVIGNIKSAFHIVQ